MPTFDYAGVDKVVSVCFRLSFLQKGKLSNVMSLRIYLPRKLSGLLSFLSDLLSVRNNSLSLLSELLSFSREPLSFSRELLSLRIKPLSLRIYLMRTFSKILLTHK